MPRPTHPWPELDNRLRELWADGVTTIEIGKALGLTKNSVIGRAHRLQLQMRHATPSARGINKRKLSRQTAPRKRDKKVRPPVPKRIEPPPPPPVRMRTPAKVKRIGTGPLSILDIGPLMCRAIVGDVRGPETMMCAQPIIMEARSPYCDEHQRLYNTGYR